MKRILLILMLAFFCGAISMSAQTIGGTLTVCSGASTTLSGAPSGGTWDSGDPAIATVNVSTGNVTGVATGTVLITYYYGSSGTATATVTVNPTPSAISGYDHVCEGSTITLTNAVPGGTWSSSNTHRGTVDATTGIVRGISMGDPTDFSNPFDINYTLCGTIVSKTVTLTPLVRLIYPNMCFGETVTLTATQSGGTWSLQEGYSNATINSSTGVANATGVGITRFRYDLTPTEGCMENHTHTDNVYIVSATGDITGDLNICEGEVTNLSSSTYAKGDWSSSNTAVAIGTAESTVDCNFTGVGAGTSTISLQVSTTCVTTAVLSVNAMPTAIIGTLSLCVGQTTPLSSTTTGGTWSSSDGDVATVDTGGIVTGVAPGTAVITYIAATGCYTTAIVTVNADPADITGTLVVCVGATTDLDCFTEGGTWSSSTTGVATVNTAGVVTGIAAGTANITFATSAGCFKFVTVTVNPTPASIAGTKSKYCSQTTTLSCSPSGGTWSSSNTSVATIGTSGIVTGISPGTTIITYLMPTGCYNTTTVTINAPVINGTPAMCIGGTVTLTVAELTGGTWTSSNTGVGTVGSTSGVVTGIGAGTANITYTKTASCYASVQATVGPTFNVTVCQVHPIRTCDNVVSYSPGMQITVAGGNSDASTTYSWSPALPVSRTMDGDLAVYTFTAAPTSGTYTVTVTKNGCAAKKSIQFVLPCCGCNPPADFFKPCATSECTGCDTTHYFKTVTAATLTNADISETVPGNYYIPSRAGNTVTLNVSPAPGSVLLMGKDITMKVFSSITLDGVHITSDTGSCQWDGIVVVNNSTARLKVTGSTLIEKATVAAVYLAGTSPTATLLSGGGDIIESNHAIYNDNTVAIQIASFNLGAGYTSVYPFEVKNSVFTARRLCNFINGTSATATNQYPFAWPTAVRLKKPVDSAEGKETGLDPLFGIDSITGVFYRPTYGGISIQNVGYTDSVGVDSFRYYGVSIGDGDTTSNTNMFDTLGIGVAVYNGNAQFYNNIFRRTPFFNPLSSNPVAGSTGIYGYQAHSDYVGKKRSIEILPGTKERTNNRFYNCHHGFFGTCWYNLVCNGAEIYTTLVTSGSDVSRMNYGIKNTTTSVNKHMGKHIIENNRIKNVRRAIDEYQESCFNPNGVLRIVGNTLSDVTPYSNAEDGGYGINVLESGSCTAVGSSLLIDANHVTGFILGIYVARQGTGNSASFNTIISNNTVVLRNELSTTSTTKKGIMCSSAKYVSAITNNEVYGDVDHGVDYNSPGVTANSHVGIELRKTSNVSGTPTDVSCNYVHDIPAGFRITEENTIDWHNNVMARNSYGLILHNLSTTDGEMGTQGGECDPTDNIWLNDDATTGGWPSTKWATSGVFQTYSVGSDPSLSKLYVRDVSTGDYIHKPTYHGYNSAGMATGSYVNGTSVLLVSTSECVPAHELCAPGVGGTEERAGNNRHTSRENAEKGLGSKYTLYPNPSNGNVTIYRHDGGEMTASVKVLNYAGAIINKGELTFAGGAASLSMGNTTPGVYMIVLTDSQGQTTTFRVVVQ